MKDKNGTAQKRNEEKLYREHDCYDFRYVLKNKY